MKDVEKAPTKEEAQKGEEKQLKKLLESAMEVAKHKLGGKAPTLEDLMSMLSEGEDASGADKVEVAPGQQAEPLQKDPSDPAILGMKVYYGMSGEGDKRKADPHKILYYEHPHGKWFDCANQAWSEQCPEVAKHLQSRPIQYSERDIVAAIANGVMDDDDYSSLDSAGMMTDTPKRLWDLTKKLGTLSSELQKSEEVDDGAEEHISPSEDSEEEVSSESSAPAPSAPEGAAVDLVAAIFAATGASQSEPASPEQLEAGENIIEQIMQAAMAAVSDSSEQMIRQIVKQELAKYGFTDEFESYGQDDEEMPTSDGSEEDSYLAPEEDGDSEIEEVED